MPPATQRESLSSARRHVDVYVLEDVANRQEFAEAPVCDSIAISILDAPSTDTEGGGIGDDDPNKLTTFR